jgi:hypothetical protein
MRPTGQCFVSGPEGDFFYFDEDISSLHHTNLLNAFGRYAGKNRIYDAEGLKWKTDGYERPLEWPSWFLVPFKVLCSPWISVTYVWSEPVEYSLEELKAVYINAVEMDDDILTQFVEADPLKKRIAQAQ